MHSIPLDAGRTRTSVLAFLTVLLAVFGLAGLASDPASAAPQPRLTTSSVGSPGLWTPTGGRVGASLSNFGDEPYTVVSAQLSGPGSEDLVLERGAGGVVAPGELNQWEYRYRPSGADVLDATITFETSVGESIGRLRFTMLASDLALEPVAFGDAPLGAERRVEVTLENRGNGTAERVELESSDPTVTLEGVPQTLAAGDSATVTAVAEPVDPGPFSGEASVSSTSQQPVVRSAFSGVGVGGRLALEPRPETIVRLGVGAPDAQTGFVLRNTGNRPLTATRARLVNQPTGGTVSYGSLFQILAPGATAAFPVSIRATARGTVTGEFAVTSDDPVAGERTVAVSAKFVAPIPVFGSTARNFGDVRVGTTEERALTVSNEGDDTLDLVLRSAPDPSGPFTVGLPLNEHVRVEPGASRSFPVRFAPTGRGVANGQVTFSVRDENGTFNNRVALLEGRGVAPVLSAVPLDFGTLQPGDEPVSRRLEFTNTGDAPLTIDDVDVHGPFTLAPTVLPIEVAPGAARSVAIEFTPTVRGAATGTVTFTSDASPATTEVAVTANVAAPVAEVEGPVAFGDVRLGETAERVLSIANTGNAELAVTDVDVLPAADAEGSGDFAVAPVDTSATIAPGATARFTLRFAPSARGPRGAAVRIVSDSDEPVADVAISGRGVAPTAAVSADAVAFGDLRVGTTSARTLTVTNDGNAPLTFTGVDLGGPDAARFSLTGSTEPLPAGAARTFALTAAPTARGALSASLTIATDAAGSPTTVALSARGVAPAAQAAPNALAFGSVARGTSSAKTVTVTNTGDAPLTLGPISVTGSDAARFVVTGDTSPVAPGASRALTVAFSPNALGARSASLLIATDATPSLAPIPLSGSGTTATWGLAIDPAAVSLLSSLGTTVRPIAPATGTNPITFPISGGTVTAAGAGTLASDGGLEYRRTLGSAAWNDVSLDLTRASVTARTGLLGLRSQVATLSEITTTPGPGDTLTIKATVRLTGTGASQLSTLTLRPVSVFSGYRLGTITVSAPRS